MHQFVSGCETQLAKYTTIKGHFQNISIVLNQMDNTSVQEVSTLVASLKSFVEVNLVMIETEIRYRLNIKNIHTWEDTLAL